MIISLKKNYEGFEEVRNFVQKVPKFGNNISSADKEAVELVKIVSEKINRQKNPFRKNFTVTGAAPVLIYSTDTGRVLLLMEEELVKI